MWSTVANFVGAKVLTALLVVSSGAAIIWFWNHPEAVQAIWETLRGALVWMGFVLIFPWATFFVPVWVMRRESNVAAATMLGGYLLANVLVAFWLGGWHFDGTLTWVVLLLGFSSATVYNFLVCDYLAERIEAQG